jgi:hypothetical protein
MADDRRQERDQKLHNLIALSREVRGSEEYRVYKELLKIKTGYSICHINFFNLKREIAIYYLNVPNLYSVRTITRTRFQNRVSAAIYNLVTSSQSFLEYNFPKSHFLETNISCFMKELRNHIAHNKPLNLTSHVKHKISQPVQRAESFSIIDFKNELEKSIDSSNKKKSHKEKALKYIEANQLKDKIHLSDLINEYFKSISAKYKECLLNFVRRNETLFRSLLLKSEKISEEMKDINCSSTVVPLEPLKIRYLKYLLFLANK